MALAEFIVLFRETLEVALIIGIILAYLYKTKNQKHSKHVWMGAGLGIVLSVVLAYALGFSVEAFEQNEAWFEGIFMVITAMLVTWLVVWITKQKEVVKTLHKEVKVHLDSKAELGLIVLVTSAVLREGVEVVLFLTGISLSTGTLSIVGSALGFLSAAVIGFLVFQYAIKFNINLFFKATAFVLVLLAAGLFSQGIHELQEAGILPTYIEHVYNINPPQNADGSYPPLHEKGAVGSIFKGMVGYDGSPSDLQVLGYLTYIGAGYAYYKKA